MVKVLEIRRKQRRWLGGFAWSSDGALLSALDHRGVLSIFEATTGSEVGSCHLGYDAREIAWIPGHAVLHVVAEDGLEAYTVSQSDGLARSHEYDWLQDQARGLVSWSPSGKLVAVDRGSSEVAVFSAAGEIYRVLAASSGRVGGLAWASASDRLAIANGNQLEIVDLQSATTMQTLTGEHSIARVQWCDDDRKLVTVSAQGVGAVWGPDGAGGAWAFPAATNLIALDVTTRSSRVWTLAWDGTLAEWDAASGACVTTIAVALRPDGIFQCVACRPHTASTASFGSDGNTSIVIWSSTQVAYSVTGVRHPRAKLRRDGAGDDAPHLGEMLNGRYLLHRLLGTGGMGAVYEAEDQAERRRVAIKLIHQDGSRHSVEMISRFEREAKAASAIDAQHITRVLDSGKDARTGVPFIVMEYLLGEDLEQLLRRVGKLPPTVALRVIAQASAGLAHAHAAGIVHRDIKPGNIWLARSEGDPAITVKLLDFGIAKFEHGDAADAALTSLTRTGAVLGTPLYMSPEQASGIKEVDHRTDIWSLGIVLYAAMAGRVPYDHVEALGNLMVAIIADPIPSVRKHAPWVPVEIAEITDTALQPDRDQRYPSAAAMRDAIMQLIDDDALDDAMLGESPAATAATRPGDN
jgi:hypothetical protein